MSQHATNFTATYRHTLRLLTFSDVRFHLQSAVDIPTFEFRQQHALIDPPWTSGTRALLTRHTQYGDSHGQLCDAMSSDEWFPTFRRIVLPSTSTASNTRPGDTVSRPTRTESSSLCEDVFRAEFHLHAPTNDGPTRRQIYRVHP